MSENFYLTSTDGKTKLHGIIWKTEGKPVAVLQIVHGMIEYVKRYSAFAEYLNSKNIAVLGIDHLGHGESAPSDDELGFFAERGGKKFLIMDQHLVTEKAKELYPGVPVFILGHSMGSFIERRYLTLFSKDVAGAIIMGTGYQPAVTCTAGMIITNILRTFKGSHYRSRFVSGLAEDAYDKTFKKKGKGSWLTKDEKIAASYENDKFCSFIFTVSGYHTMFSILRDLAKGKNNKYIRKDLPIIFVSGMDDPVGDYTKGVLRVYNEYVKLGITDLDIKFYENDRHEILNELDRDVVYSDLYAFISERI